MTPDDFRVSVIITSYNQKHYLIEAVESVIGQTLRPHEIIVADDHSTDGESVEIIGDYAARYPGWIKGVFQPQNIGIPKNRNAALRQVTGNYITILDGDDRFLPDKLQRERAALNSLPPAGCAYSNVRYIDSEGRPKACRDQHELPSGDVFTFIAQGRFGLLRSMVIDYTLLQRSGFFREDLPSYDGFELTVRAARDSRFAYIGDPLVENRVHDVSYQTKMKARDHVHDLQIIYHTMRPWLAGLPAAEKEQIILAWQGLLLRFRLRDALEQKSRMKAYAVLLWSVGKNRSRWKSLRYVAQKEMPGLWPFS